MKDAAYLDDESIRHAFNRFCGKFSSGHIVDSREFSVAFAEELRAAFRKASGVEGRAFR